MRELRPTVLAGEADPGALEKLVAAERIALGAVIALAILNLAVSFLPMTQQATVASLRPMSGEAVLFALMSALSLLLLDPDRSQRSVWAGWALAAAMLLLCCIIGVARLPHHTSAIAPISSDLQAFWLANAPISPQAASGFALLGISMMFLRAHSRKAVFLADVFAGCLVLLVLVLASEQVLDMSGIYGRATDPSHSFQTMLCLLLLTTVTFCRRTRVGFFSIFLGSGAGSRLARTLSPILLLIPYFREWTSARLIDVKTVSAPYSTAILATLAVLLASLLLIYLALRINSLEKEIHSLSLRDELTGLYNLRGFRLLAQQALRVAKRSGRLFSVLFIDVDNLKKINDQLGHSTGSQCLISTAEIMRAVFRESDILGRVGGDEFAVAGEFTESGAALALRRLEGAIEKWNAEPKEQIVLSLSFGAATSTAGTQETLDTLLALSDQEMYNNKRKKKNAGKDPALP